MSDSCGAHPNYCFTVLVLKRMKITRIIPIILLLTLMR